MSDEEADGPFPIGRRHGKVYLLTVKPPQKEYWERDRDFEDAEGSISITLIARDQHGNEEDILRIDNSHEDMGIHKHRFYSKEDDWEELDMNFPEALEHVYENWQHYADVNEGMN